MRQPLDLTDCERFLDGQRVGTHPATDAWMRGERYGEFVCYTRGRHGHPVALVKLDSGRMARFRPQDVVSL